MVEVTTISKVLKSYKLYLEAFKIKMLPIVSEAVLFLI